jgi:uncharacterized OB-fold protein
MPVIVPEETDLSRPYWEGARNGQLLIQRCNACSELWHPPSPACPACQSFDYEWAPMSGSGTVFGYTIVAHPVHPAVVDKVPYVIAQVRLTEGPFVVANIIDSPQDQVRVGAPVQVTFQEVAPGHVLPQFRLA